LIAFAAKAGSLPQRKNFSAWQAFKPPLTLETFSKARRCHEPRCTRVAEKRRPHMEATMELAMRLNVLAALLSFGFIAAIVIGIV
jgi:hypothetical protein